MKNDEKSVLEHFCESNGVACPDPLEHVDEKHLGYLLRVTEALSDLPERQVQRMRNRLRRLMRLYADDLGVTAPMRIQDEVGFLFAILNDDGDDDGEPVDDEPKPVRTTSR